MRRVEFVAWNWDCKIRLAANDAPRISVSLSGIHSVAHHRFVENGRFIR